MRVSHLMRWLAAVAAAGLFSVSFAAGIDAERYRANVRTLSSDAMRGRGTGSPELEKAARFLASEFKRTGIPPADGRSYFQRFGVTTGAKLGGKNTLAYTSGGSTVRLKLSQEFQPFNFSANGTAQGEVVFAGYGITAPEYHYDDYAGLDVKDKIVLVVRHEPQEFDEKSVFAGRTYTRHAQTDNKAINAKMHGAKAVVLVNDVPNHTDPDTLETFRQSVAPGGTSIPFLQVTTSVAEGWFKAGGITMKDWIAAVDQDLKPKPVDLKGLSVALAVDVQRQTRQVPNVWAYLKGETDEYLIIGAHFDHLGMGEQSSMAPSLAGKEIHHGADDNASGTAGVLELAHYFKSQPRLKRGVLFLAFSGEELGLLGSAHYAGNPVLPLDKAVAMVNMDMIGRIKDGRVFVGGTGTGTTLKALIEGEKPNSKLQLDLSDQGGYGSSDHMSFNIKQVPVLFFFSGLHADYHKPSDTWEKIEAASAADLLTLVAGIGTKLIEGDSRPQYVRLADPRPQAVASASASGAYGPYFGGVPDMGANEGGYKVADVRDGSPAFQAGLRAGDIVVEFGGKPVASLMEFTYVLRSHKPGDEVLVKWKRNGAPMEGKTVLSTRK